MEQKVRLSPEEWKAQKQAERDAVYAAQDAAIKKVMSSGENLAAYLTGSGRLGSAITVSNAAVVLDAMPQARCVKTIEKWNECGRRINKGAKGVRVITRQHGFPAIGVVFDVSQTYGDTPVPRTDLSADADACRDAVNAMANLAPVPIENGLHGDMPADYDPDHGKILINEQADMKELFQFLPAAIVQASIHEKAPDTDPESAGLYALGAALEVAGRFGVQAMPKQRAGMILDRYLKSVKPGTERAVLNIIHDFARTIGNSVEQTIHPPVKEPPAKHAPQPERGGRA